MKLYSLSCSRASDFGLLKIDENGQIRQFLEKPKGESLRSMVGTFPLISWYKFLFELKLAVSGLKFLIFTASWYNCSWINRSRCKENPIHCINGYIFIQDRSTTETTQVRKLEIERISSKPHQYSSLLQLEMIYSHQNASICFRDCNCFLDSKLDPIPVHIWWQFLCVCSRKNDTSFSLLFLLL